MSKTKSLLSRDNLRKLDPKVYFGAAEVIRTKRQNFSCLAIEDTAPKGPYGYATWDTYRPYVKAFEEAFEPDVYGQKGHFWNMAPSPSRQLARYNALVLMGTMVEQAKANRGKKKSKKDKAVEAIAASLPKVRDPSSMWPFPLEG